MKIDLQKQKLQVDLWLFLPKMSIIIRFSIRLVLRL